MTTSPPPSSRIIVVRNDVVGNVVVLVTDPNETWGRLAQRIIENDYPQSGSRDRLLPLLTDMHPRGRLSAYRLRYDHGRGTIIRPNWSSSSSSSSSSSRPMRGDDAVDDDYGEIVRDGLDANVPVVADAYIDVNVSLRPCDVASHAFEPYETILSSLGEGGGGHQGTTTFVDLHWAKIDMDREYDEYDDGGSAPASRPFPIRWEMTTILICDEHPKCHGCVHGYELVEDGIRADDDGRHRARRSLPRKCVNARAAGENDRTLSTKRESNVAYDPNIDAARDANVGGGGCVDEESATSARRDDDCRARESRRRRTDEDVEGETSGTSSTHDAIANAGGGVVVARSHIEKRSTSRENAISVDAGAASTDADGMGTSREGNATTTHTTSESSSANVTVPVEDSASDSVGVPVSTADASSDSVVSSHSTGRADNARKELRPPGSQSSEAEPSSDVAVEMAADVEMSLSLDQTNKSKDHAKISDAKSHGAIRRADGSRNKKNAKMPAANTTNDVDESIPAAPAAKKGRERQNRGKEKIPPVTAATNEIDVPTTAAAEPAVGLPPGWTMRRIPRIGSGRSDTRYFSPNSNRLFRTKPDALRFVKALDSSDGDDEEAMVLFRIMGKGTKNAAVARGTSDDGVDDKRGGTSGTEAANATAQPKRKRKTGATTKALQDLALGKEDGSTTTTYPVVGLKRPSKK